MLDIGNLFTINLANKNKINESKNIQELKNPRYQIIKLKYQILLMNHQLLKIENQIKQNQNIIIKIKFQNHLMK